MNPNALQALQQWYLAQCDGDWEHGYGVSITTLDNPGWSLDITAANRNLLSGKLELRLSEKHESGGCETFRSITGKGATLAEALDSIGAAP